MERLPLHGSEPDLVWPHDVLSHAHADFAERYLVADIVPSNDPDNRKVLFRNLRTSHTVEIVSHLPDIGGLSSRYHVHPHPQFCRQDSLICYTTTVLGSVDVAFTRVEDLVEKTARA